MRSKRTWLGILLALAGVVLISAVITVTRPPAEEPGLPRLSAHSARPQGALALYLWTARLGRRADYLEYRAFRLTAEDAVLVSLEPVDGYNAEQVQQISAWLREGGTLLLATEQSSRIHRELGMTARYGYVGEYTAARLAQPLHMQPPVLRLAGRSRSQLDAGTAVPVLIAEVPNGGPAVVSTTVGRGKAWVMSMPSVFANENLRQADNAALYEYILATARPGRVLFDEYHHGRTEVVSLRALIYHSRWGWALMYTALLLLVYTALRGKRLGRPLRSAPNPNRNAGEYVRSLASLLQRADKRDLLARHYASRLRQLLQLASGSPPGTDLDTLRAAVEQSTGVPPTATVRAIRELEQTAPPIRRILELVREAQLEREKIVRRGY